jgi:hypothetical protein
MTGGIHMLSPGEERCLAKIESADKLDKTEAVNVLRSGRFGF